MATPTTDIIPPAIGSEELERRQSELASRTAPTIFRVAGQLLARGRTDTPLAATEDLSIRLKIYAEGGENELHAHPSEDHTFIVLQGRARFFDPDEKETVIGPNQGILLPRGCVYKFFAVEGEPLVMLRIGTPNFQKQPKPNRTDAEGKPMRGDSKENKSVPVEFLEGRYFG